VIERPGRIGRKVWSGYAGSRTRSRHALYAGPVDHGL